MAWELFRRDGVDGFEMMGVDGDLLVEAPLPELPIAVEVTIEAPSTLPEFVASAELAIERITDELGGRIAGTSRTATTLWTLVALASDEHAARFAQVPLPAKASVSVAPSRDPGWTIFERVRPVDMEEQSLHDLRRMAALHADGDVGGVRVIEHDVSGLAPERSAAFVAAVASVGFEPAPPDDGSSDAGSLDAGSSDGGRMVLRHAVDPADITPDSWTLRLIAERHGAVYDGWRCSVVRARGADRPRRRWRRS
jgi:hypothetical protein